MIKKYKNIESNETINKNLIKKLRLITNSGKAVVARVTDKIVW